MSRSIDVRHLHWYKNEQGDYIASGYENLYMIKSIGEGIYRAYYKAWTWSAVVPWKKLVIPDGPFKEAMALCNDDNEAAVEFWLDEIWEHIRRWR